MGRDASSSEAKVLRHKISAAQTQRLEAVLSECPFPDRDLRARLSAELDLPLRTVQVWFQNRRQRGSGGCAQAAEGAASAAAGTASRDVVEENGAVAFVEPLPLVAHPSMIAETVANVLVQASSIPSAFDACVASGPLWLYERVLVVWVNNLMGTPLTPVENVRMVFAAAAGDAAGWSRLVESAHDLVGAWSRCAADATNPFEGIAVEMTVVEQSMAIARDALRIASPSLGRVV